MTVFGPCPAAGLVFFDELPSPPFVMPLFGYRKLVTEREARRKAAAQEELDRLAALTDADCAWLTANGCDVQKLEWDCRYELLMMANYR